MGSRLKRGVFLFLSHLLHGRTHFLFTLLVAFLLSVAAARVFGISSLWRLQIAGYHIHHFYTGILLVSASAIALLLVEPGINSRSYERKKLFFARAIGAGMGLIVDEIGLLLSCTTEGLFCDYRYGDLGNFVSVVFLVIIFLIVVIEFPHPWLVQLRSYLPHHSIHNP